MNSGITLVDVRNEAMDAIKKLKNGEMDTKTASEIRNLLNTIIDTGKVQVEFMKAIPDHLKQNMKPEEIKAIAGTLRDRDTELDLSLDQIENSKNSYQSH